jgi:serine/threonine protein kinase
VYKGRRRCTGQITAMKFIVKHGKSEKDIRNLRQEIEILRQLKHENIIQMLDAFETKTDFCVVTGACVGGSVCVCVGLAGRWAGRWAGGWVRARRQGKVLLA